MKIVKLCLSNTSSKLLSIQGMRARKKSRIFFIMVVKLMVFVKILTNWISEKKERGDYEIIFNDSEGHGKRSYHGIDSIQSLPKHKLIYVTLINLELLKGAQSKVHK